MGTIVQAQYCVCLPHRFSGFWARHTTTHLATSALSDPSGFLALEKRCQTSLGESLEGASLLPSC